MPWADRASPAAVSPYSNTVANPNPDPSPDPGPSPRPQAPTLTLTPTPTPAVRPCIYVYELPARMNVLALKAEYDWRVQRPQKKFDYRMPQVPRGCSKGGLGC